MRLFRRIRQNLLAKGKTLEYIKYAIGEILLIMLGILLALQVENWNQNRTNKNLENQYYHRLLEDLKEEKEIVQSALNYSTQVISHAKRAIVVFENAADNIDNPVDNLIDMYQASQIKDPNSASTTYEELISSGHINLIRNDSLKTALIRYYEILWTETAMYQISNTYRDNLRSKMPDFIQTEIRSKCGDTYIKLRSAYDVALPKSCVINIDFGIAQNVVRNLRKDQSLKMDLRVLIGNENSKLEVIRSVKRQLEDLINQFDNLEMD